MIVFSCPDCAKELKVKDELAGKKGKCPHCKAGVTVPGTPVDGQKTLVGAGRTEEAKTLAPPGMSGEAKTLAPPKKPGVGDAKTLAPSTKPSASKLGGKPGPEAKTLLPGASAPKPSRKIGETLSPDAPTHGDATTEFTEFLEPAQQAGELGRLGKYRILKILGAGGMGVVYQADDTVLKRSVALKALLPGMNSSKSARERFLREAQSSAALQHDNVVTVYEVNEANNVPFLAMQLLQGEALDSRLAREATLPLDEVLRIGREAAEGLAAAHDRGMIHRDIKPANLFLEAPKGRVKILDFGLARPSGESKLTQLGAVVGTPGYLSPEQANGKPVDARGDLFSLGCVLYRITTGELPFKGEDMLSLLTSLATTVPDAPSKINIEVPPALSNLIMRLLSKEPNSRPATGHEVSATLTAIGSGTAPAAPMMALVEDEEEVVESLPADSVVEAPRVVVQRDGLTTRGRSDRDDGYDDEGMQPRREPGFPMWIVWTCIGATVFFIVAGVGLYLGLRNKDDSPAVVEEGGKPNNPQEKDRLERQRLEKERLERERIEREQRLERDRLERERLEQERIRATDKSIKPFRSKRVEGGNFHFLAFHPDSKHFVSANNPDFNKGQIVFWDVDKEEAEDITPVFLGTIGQAPRYSSDGKRIIFGAGTTAVVIDTTKTPKPVLHALAAQEIKPLRPNQGVTADKLLAVAFTDKDQPLAVFSGHLLGKRYVGTFEVETKKLHGVWIPFDSFSLSDVILIPDGNSIILIDNNVMGVWDKTTTGAPKAVFRGLLEGKPKKYALSPDGKTFMTSHSKNEVKLWNVQTGAVIKSYTFGTSMIDSVGFSPDGKSGICANSPGESRYYVWDLETGAIQAEMAGQGWMNSTAISPDEKIAIGGCWGGGPNNLFWYRLPAKEEKKDDPKKDDMK